MAAKGSNESRTRRNQYEDPYIQDPIKREFDQFQRRRVDPVRVLDNPKHGLAGGKTCQLVEKNRERSIAPLLGRQIKRAVARSGVETYERRYQRCGLTNIARGRRKEAFEAVQTAIQG